MRGCVSGLVITRGTRCLGDLVSAGEEQSTRMHSWAWLVPAQGSMALESRRPFWALPLGYGIWEGVRGWVSAMQPSR